MPAYNVVTNTANGGMLRYGSSAFNLGSEFDGSVETYTADVGKKINGLKNEYHKVVGGVLAEMTQGEKDIIDAAVVILSVSEGLIAGCKLEFNSTSLVRITKGYCRDSTNFDNMFLLADINLDMTVTGSAAGLQVAEAASTFYDIYVIKDTSNANAVSVWGVPQGTSVVLPSTYDRFRYVGSVRNNSSSNIINFICSGNGRDRKLQYRGSSSDLEIYDGGGTANVFTSLNLSSLVPAGVEFLDLQVHLDMDSDSDKIFLQSGINPQTTANSLLKYGSGLSTEDFQFYDFQVWGMAIDPSTPSLEWGTSVVGQDVTLSIIGYNIYL